MIRWRAPDLTPADLAALDALDLADEAEARFGRYSAADRLEWERHLAATGERRGRPKAQEKAAGGAGAIFTDKEAKG